MPKYVQQLIVVMLMVAVAVGIFWLGYASAERVHSVHCDCGWTTADYQG